MRAIAIENLTKRYQEAVAVENLSLTVEEGELFSLLGVNGAGKTTVIRTLCGLTLPSSGSARILGNDIVKERAQVKANIGISPQETAIAPNLTVEENLALLCGVYGLKKQARAERIEALINTLGLESVAKRRAGKLSGGWQRRLSIAMALVGEPKVLFLDEPTLGLDVLARSELWDCIRGIKGKTTVVLTTHYMEEAEALSDRVGILSAGKLIALGSVEELKAQTGADSLEKAFIAIVKGVKA